MDSTLGVILLVALLSGFAAAALDWLAGSSAKSEPPPKVLTPEEKAAAALEFRERVERHRRAGWALRVDRGIAYGPWRGPTQT